MRVPAGAIRRGQPEIEGNNSLSNETFIYSNCIRRGQPEIEGNNQIILISFKKLQVY